MSHGAERDPEPALRAFVEPVDVSHADARYLMGSLDDYLSSLYLPEDNFLELPAEDVRDGRGLFLVAYGPDRRALGCGAIRALDDYTGEIKRMWVEPGARGNGVATAILGELTKWARSRGLARLVLESGAAQPEALSLYAREGFTEIPRFGPYACAPNSICLAKRLA